ncbi:hypothetical protein QCD70_17520 [Agreia sp. PsM10]|jgi:hypothetical protein|uniref:hypothetical protein n=1 Tax=Agreia sp. PsM10 TaxID=3030533 RepID=UPI00263BDFCC|nr:hypothetical protein [Agreia sp. PsM10]MDN4642049.1 hypothetical protein [Agreia sp. PsM10]
MTHEKRPHGLSSEEDLEKDTSYSPSSEHDDDVLENEAVTDSDAVDADMDSSEILVLPGTGGPDDVGDIEVDPSEFNLSGDSIPGHPKPASHPH